MPPGAFIAFHIGPPRAVIRPPAPTPVQLDVLTATAAEISAAAGGRPVIPLACDVRDPDAVARLYDALAAHPQGGVPTVVVNNAAGNFVAPFERLSPGGWKAVTEIVLNGACVRAWEVGGGWKASAAP